MASPLPVFCFTVKQLQTIGLVHPSTRGIRRNIIRCWGLVIFVSTAIFTTQKVVSIFVSGDLPDRCSHIRDVSTMGTLLIIQAEFHLHSDSLFKVMEGLSVTETVRARDAVASTSRLTERLSKLFTADIVVLAVLIMLAPLGGSESAMDNGHIGTWRIVKGLPMTVWYPVDISTVEVYACMYVSQTLAVAAELFAYTTFFCSFVTICFHFSTQFRLLSDEMANCKLGEVKQCIQKHQFLLSLVRELNMSVRTLMGWYVLAAVLCMGTTSLEIITVKMGSSKQMASALYLVSQAAGLLLCCQLGDFVTASSEKFFESTSMSPWTEMSIEEQKLMITVCGQAKKSVTVKAGSLYNLSLSLYSELVKTWYQLFNVLKKLT